MECASPRRDTVDRPGATGARTDKLAGTCPHFEQSVLGRLCFWVVGGRSNSMTLPLPGVVMLEQCTGRVLGTLSPRLSCLQPTPAGPCALSCGLGVVEDLPPEAFQPPVRQKAASGDQSLPLCFLFHSTRNGCGAQRRALLDGSGACSTERRCLANTKTPSVWASDFATLPTCSQWSEGSISVDQHCHFASRQSMSGLLPSNNVSTAAVGSDP